MYLKVTLLLKADGWRTCNKKAWFQKFPSLTLSEQLNLMKEPEVHFEKCGSMSVQIFFEMP